MDIISINEPEVLITEIIAMDIENNEINNFILIGEDANYFHISTTVNHDTDDDDETRYYLILNSPSDFESQFSYFLFIVAIDDLGRKNNQKLTVNINNGKYLFFIS